MSYMALYRKFRPSSFDDVKGQDSIVKTLKNQIKSQRVGHAYLFCGTRGTGKTTIAKILAKAVNCEHPIEGNPCNQCKACLSIIKQTSMNVIEIDAASNNGVDNIREIVEEIQYSPTEGNYKVYIIDEVHMLSTGAFNALLKTLEEPPSYVMFILATTEAHKIPITILSRCQRYDFRRITIDVIGERLNELMKKEGVFAEEKAIRYLAKVADGSMRDALSLLDQCIAFYFGEELTYDKVLDVLGAVDVEVYASLFDAISTYNVISCLEILDQSIINGKEIGQFINDFIWYLRNMLLVSSSNQATDMVDVSSDYIEILRKKASVIPVDTLMRYIRIFSELSNQIKYATQKRVLTEVAFVKICRPMMEENYDSILERIRAIENQLKSGIVVQTKDHIESQSDKIDISISEQSVVEESIEQALPDELKELAKNWNQIKNQLPFSIKSFLQDAVPTIGQDNTLLLVFTDSTQYAFFSKEQHIKELEDTIKSYIQRQVTVHTKLMEANQVKHKNNLDITKCFRMPVTKED